ncbi:phage repressor protein [Pantoea stewartii]|uniref:Phage repressor protein n=1 Tax=Pantoea stewartii subsp. stewartii DC283 TaxID=660596 RepID=A0ABM6K9I7_PANSE|nr:phage repressor protein [Pantoea stewartii]ARF50778.1 phage repressor protein [Pantoea stewartii subsp. stewartii DC283]
MGFPSPAADFVESRIDLNKMMIHRPSSTIRIETPRGFALVDGSITPVAGNKVAWQVDGYPMVGKYFRHGIITEDGETIDGESLEGVVMLGVVTFEVLSVHEPDTPII